MIQIGKIRFKESARLHTFWCEGLKLEPGDVCIVKAAPGLKLGEVIVGPRHLAYEEKCLGGMIKAVRKATREDIRRHEDLVRLEEEAFKVCENKIEERELTYEYLGFTRRFAVAVQIT